MVTMSGVWDRTTEFLSDNIGAVTTIAALTMFVPGVVEGVLAPVNAAAQPGAAKLGMSVLSLLVSLIGLFGQTALIALAIDPARGRRGAFATGVARFLPMIGVSVVLLLLLLVAFLPPILLLAVEGVDLDAVSTGVAPNVSPMTALLAFLYLLILLPLLVWVIARLSVVSSVVVAERRGLGAIKHGWALTRGLALRIAGAVILLLVVGGVAVLATELVFGSLFRLLLGDEGLMNAATILTAVFVSLVATGLTVVVTAFLAKLYVAVAHRATAAAPA